MANRSCNNCGHDVSISVNPQNQIAELYHYEERGLIIKSITYSKKCPKKECACTDPSSQI
jgi:hypothetical protein